MAAEFAVSLLFKSKGQGELSKFAQGAGKVDSAVKKAQGSTDKLGKALGGVGAKAGQAANGISKTGRAAAGASKGVNKLAGAIKGLIGIYAVVQATKFVFVKTAELETQTRSLKVLTGSMETARDVVKELQAFGNVTPFTSTELIETAKRLKAFGVDTERLVDTTKRLGDVAGATGADLSGIATAYGQIMAKGRLQGEELLQLQERGIALQPELQAMYKLSGDEFRKALEKGQISAEAVELALQRLTEAGGTYANGAIAQSDTLNGRLSTLQDNIQRLAQNIGRILKPVFEWVINQSIRAVEAINRMLGQWKKEDAIGQSRKFELQRQAAADAESKFGRFNLSKEKDQYRKSQYQTYLNNEAAKNGVGTTPTKRIEQKVDLLKLEIPKLLGQTGTGTGTGTSKATASAPRATFISIEELGRALQGMGYTVKEHPSFGGVSGGHAPNSYHKYGEALDVTDHRSGDWMGRTKQLENQLRGSGAGFAELLGPASGAAGHETHIHIAAASGQVQLTPELAAVLGLPGAGERGASALQVMNQQAEAMMQNLAQGRQTIEGMVSDMQGGTQGLQDEFDNSQLRDRLELEGMASQEIAIQIERADRLRNIQRQQETALAKLIELQASGKITEDQKLATEQQITAELQKQAGLIESLATAKTARAQNATEELTEVQKLSQSISDSLEGGIVDALGTGIAALATGAEDLDKKLQQILQGVLADIANQLLKFAMSQVFKSIGGGGAGGLFGGFFADGGTLPGNSISVVGENGPELADTRGGSTEIIPLGKYSMANGNKAGGAGANGANGADGAEGGAPTFRLETTVINGQEYATVEQVRAMGQASVKQGAASGKAQTLGTLRNSRSQRSKLGLR